MRRCPPLDDHRPRRGSRARAGVLHTAHGDVRTPAFVPLATKATVSGLMPAEVAALGYDMVLGNTFHLFLDPGHELIARFGGLHEFMGWRGPIVTDSGGFQVFSMGHGTVADEVKGRAPPAPTRQGAVLAIEEEGVRFRSYIDGSRALHGARDVDGDPGRAGLRHRARLRRVHAVPRRPRLHRALDRAHPPLARPLPGLARRARPATGQLVYGIVQGGVYEDLRVESAQTIAAQRAATGIAIGGSLGAEKEQMYEVVDWTTAVLPEDRPRHLLGHRRDRRPRPRRRARHRHASTARCRRAWAATAMALVPDPERRWRVDLTKPRWQRRATSRSWRAARARPARAGYTRGYLHYLLQRARADRPCGC